MPTLRVLSFAVLAALFLSASHAALPNGVAAGDVTASSVVLWARADAATSLRFELSLADTFAASLSNQTFTVSNPNLPVKQELNNLQPATTYYYRVTDSRDGTQATGQFRTAAAAGSALRGLRFGVTGDWRGELAPYPAVRNIAEAKLDFVVLLGDTIYADYPSPALAETATETNGYILKHQEVLSARHGLNIWPEVRASTVAFVTLDDHEVINDFSGAAAPATDDRFDAMGAFINETLRYTQAVQVFQDYMPIKPERYGDTGDARTSGKVKLYRARQFGADAAIFVPDARSFRDAPLADVQNLADPLQVGAFLTGAFNPTRTLLGRVQLEELKQDLLDAERAGVLWKFVMVPEPIQNLGLAFASDRYEGYAAERTELLRFIRYNNLRNVVFVAADIHGTVVNNLTYQEAPFLAQFPTLAWEISTGAVAFDAPFGPTVAQLGAALGLISAQELAFYNSLPINPDSDDVPNDRDDFIKLVVNGLLANLGYDTVGLQNSIIPATLLAGDYVALHSYGWTEFAIAADTGALTVTTYGIPAYTQAELEANPTAITSRTPAVVSQFRVAAKH